MATKKTTNGHAIDAVALLKADHRAVEALFEQFENATGKVAKSKLDTRRCTA